MPHTGRSLYQQLQHDIAQKDGGDASIVFGGLYYEDMAHRYSDEGSLFGLLRPDAGDDSAPNGQLLQVFLCPIFKSYFFKIFLDVEN